MTRLQQFCQEEWARNQTTYCGKLVEGNTNGLSVCPVVSVFLTISLEVNSNLAVKEKSLMNWFVFAVIRVHSHFNKLSVPLCPAALQALKRKKRYEQQLAQIDGTLSTIEFQREALENANTNTEVLKNMGYAAKAMKAAHENM